MSSLVVLQMCIGLFLISFSTPFDFLDSSIFVHVCNTRHVFPPFLSFFPHFSFLFLSAVKKCVCAFVFIVANMPVTEGMGREKKKGRVWEGRLHVVDFFFLS